MADELVLTPGGMRPLSLVQQVGEGQVLRAAEGVVHRIASGDSQAFEAALLSNSIDQVALQFQSTAALGSGWIAYAYWNNGTGSSITNFVTNWVVPPAPATQSGQTIFLFNGIQNYGNNFGILQPVLQWGMSAAGGGPYWAVSNWYVTSGGQALYTPLVRVNAGDMLTGVMQLTGQSGSGFNYTSAFTGIGNTLSVENIAELLWANETLEAYSVGQCSDYPAVNGTAFTDVAIQTAAGNPELNWTAVSAVTDCGQHAMVASNANPGGEIDLFYS